MGTSTGSRKNDNITDFRQQVLSFQGLNKSQCLVERAIELDYVTRIRKSQGFQQPPAVCSHNNTNKTNDDCNVNKPLLPQQAQEKLHTSPAFRNAVLSFEGQSGSLVERAIEYDFMTQVRKCIKRRKTETAKD